MEEKTEKEGIVRDISTGALLNKNINALTAYKKRRQMNDDFENFKVKIVQIDNDLSEIKQILKSMVEKI
jgi:hypothetical protein